MATNLKISNLTSIPLRVGKTGVPSDGSPVTVDLEDPETRRALAQYKGLWLVYASPNDVELEADIQDLQARPQWFVGQGAPSDEIGRDGDFYLDKDTSNIYLKEGGTWG